jgi:hypothetical protein
VFITRHSKLKWATRILMCKTLSGVGFSVKVKLNFLTIVDKCYVQVIQFLSASVYIVKFKVLCIELNSFKALGKSLNLTLQEAR